MAFGGQLADDGVDLRLCLDIDAARRLVEQKDAAVGIDPAADHDLLLVAARQRPDRRVGFGRLDVDAAG